MARRHQNWNIGLAGDLRDKDFAREFPLGVLDEEVPLQVALRTIVRARGVKEFAAKVAMASPNLLRTLNPRHNPRDTLNRREALQLKLSLAPISNPTPHSPYLQRVGARPGGSRAAQPPSDARAPLRRPSTPTYFTRRGMGGFILMNAGRVLAWG